MAFPPWPVEWPNGRRHAALALSHLVASARHTSVWHVVFAEEQPKSFYRQGSPQNLSLLDSPVPTNSHP